MKINSFKGIKRSGYCADFSAADSGRKVTVAGWVQRRRVLGGLIFIALRDRSGLLQLTFDEAENKELFDEAYSLRPEDVICADGEIRRRGEAAVNENMATGDIEVFVEKLYVVSKAETTPFEIVENSNVNEELRLKYRYLDLRRPDMQKTFILRHELARLARNYFSDNGFLEIETPDLIKSSPEGARDYLVPSRVHPGEFYALPQSPQLYKQLLMVAGFDRYMQLARCFRDEDLRAERQPEFTQIDLEMSFVDIDDVIEVNEGFIKKAFKELIGYDVETPLRRMPYKEAMSRYGSDKPDLRFGFEINDLTEVVRDFGFKVFSDAVKNGGSVRAIVIDNGADKLSRREIDSLTEFVKTYRAKGLAWIKVGEELSGSFLKFLTDAELEKLSSALSLEKNDAVFIVADKDDIVFDSLGALRCEIARRLGRIPEGKYELLWVTEFPLLEYNEEEGRYVAKHHPFTSVMDEDVELLGSAPEKARAKAYDIVINGYEAGGGSIRIFDAELQRKMFEVIGLSPEEAEEKFGYLLTAFKYGVPPHGGMAYGLDRLVMLLSGKDNIRDVIAFPKVQNASELMTMCPSPVEDKQLDELGIKIVKKQQ
ncbi:MAG: aspartate--tRNA ligase [Clostridiales bacterium]|nr:aspartate--tRNA ligase [Clostridiales bacterium]